MEKVNAWNDKNKSGGRAARIRKSYAVANGLSPTGDGVSWEISRGGEQGEVLFSVENHFRAIGMSLLNITTAQRPAVQVGAVNTDKKSLMQAILGGGLIDLHLTERRLESLLKRGAKSAIFLTEGLALVEWDASAGEPLMQNPAHVEEAERGERDPSSVGIIKTGEPKVTYLGPLDVIRDEYAPSWDDLSWLITTEYQNKHDLAARYEEFADKIHGLETKDENTRINFSLHQDETDLVPVYKFFHKDTPALPGGRMVTFLAEDIVVFDGPLPYLGKDKAPELPVYRVVCDEVEGTPFGSSPMLDLLGPQDSINAIDTTITTNELGRGIGNLLVPRNANISLEAVNSSMNEIRYDGEQKPEPLAWPATPAEFFSYKQEKIRAMELLSGVNSVVRGEPSEAVGNDASGAKLAFLGAQSIQANSGLQNSWVQFVRDVCLAILHRYRDFGGDVKRVAQLAGKNNQYMVREFTSKDLDGVDRITVDVGNPLMRTVTGKMAIADKLVEMGVIQPGTSGGDQYLAFIKTGNLEPAVEGKQNLQLRIRSENEALMEGQPVRAIISDPHWTEIDQHLSILDNLALREPGSDAIQEAVLAHVQEHRDLFLQMPPDLVMLRGGQPAFEMWSAIQQAMTGMAPGATQTPPPQPGAASSTPPPQSGAENVVNPEGSAPDMPGMPGMPTNPATGQQAEIPAGALQ